MKKMPSFFLLSFSFLFLFAADSQLNGQSVPISIEDRQAVINTALDYGDGYYSGNGDRMQRAIHPDLHKVWITPVPKSNRMVLRYATYSGLIEASRSGAGFRPEAKRNIRVSVLFHSADIACARLTSSLFNDYLQLIKCGESWKIINVLWTPGPDFPNWKHKKNFSAEAEKGAVEEVAGNYCRGLFAADAASLESAIHPESNRASFRTNPKTGVKAFNRFGAGFMLGLARAGLGALPEDKREFRVDVLDIMDGLAFVTVNAPLATEYLQAAKIEGKWTVINSLHVPTPRGPGREKK